MFVDFIEIEFHLLLYNRRKPNVRIDFDAKYPQAQYMLRITISEFGLLSFIYPYLASAIEQYIYYA